MDTLEGMRTFATVVAEGSFSGAAERLDRSPQLVSKYVAQLEARLGVRLLNRSTRRLSITEAGQAYFDRCRQIVAEVDELESAVGDLSRAVRGTLRINAPMTFGMHHLTPAIAAFQDEHPDLEVELALDDRVVDVVSEGFDLAVRITRLDASSLVARPLAPVRLVVCAAPAYLDTRGYPETPRDLAAHDCLGYTYWAGRDTWRFESDAGVEEVQVGGRFSANNGDALRMAALAGHGLIMQPTFIVGDDLRNGRLVPLLPGHTVAPLKVYAVYAHRQYLSGKVRAFVDFLIKQFGPEPYWDRDLDVAGRIPARR
jgi:DNA-binding transcriptional LysR family regulator